MKALACTGCAMSVDSSRANAYNPVFYSLKREIGEKPFT